MAQCAIALGSNLGDSLTTLKSALNILQKTPGIELIAVSNWYKTKPISPIPQADYLNGCATLNVRQNPEELLTLLQAIELQFGRVRTRKWEARTLDLDIILYDNLIVDKTHLKIPHPLMSKRAFVLVPLAEIAGNWYEPRSQKEIANLASAIDTSGVTLI